MPATAGRVPMPHNNRMSTSVTLRTNEMWSKSIGHDPHAAEGEAEAREEEAAKRERQAGLLELARRSNVDQGLGDRGANFAQSVFWGLKRDGKPPKGFEIPVLPDDDEEEEEDEDDSPVAKVEKKKKKKKRRRDGSADGSDDDEPEKKKHKKKKKKKKHRHHRDD